MVGLALRYISCKLIFIRFCRIPKAFGNALNEKAMKILKIALILRGVISIYMYGGNGVFQKPTSAYSIFIIFFLIIFII